MDSIDVLRFEDCNGAGPYCSPRSPYSYDNCDRSAKARRMRELFLDHRGDSHPNPHQGGEPWDVGVRHDDDVCGFRDLDQLCAWFSDEEVELMLDFGFSLVTYRVPASDVRVGRKQACFVKGQARPEVFLPARSVGQECRNRF